MFYRLDIGSMIMNIIIVSTLICAVIFVAEKEGIINIELPYYSELKTCEAELDILEEKITPKCPDVICKSSNDFNFILILICWIVFFCLYIFKREKNRKKPNKVKK